jgi:FkbM family methyltransferase
MSFKRKLVLFYVKILKFFLTLLLPGKVKGFFMDAFHPTHPIQLPNGKSLSFCLSSEIIYWRMDTFFNKEPETLKWIDQISSQEVLFDIGANIGTFSLYAGSRGITVYAFEPEAMNFSELCQNIRLNHLHKVKPFSLAVSSQNTFIGLTPSAENAGEAKHATGYHSQVSHKSTTQYSYSMSIDKLLEDKSIEFPAYIKVDVDGLERDIINGMVKTLKDSRLKSVLIEIDENRIDQLEIIKIMESSGLNIAYKTNFAFNINNYIFSKG